ncbi:fibronectin type III domain-containing protein [Saccharothrix coeruleofusca]|uniref:Fibronectin type-III domain-containing protein n=1 Tax=Saccharothrix coeruleofusca TaxID=33919 RepID=A0A918EER8_9PSEU|nr:fibronectin type III domain-containing protein [Saccharothrix coeruleofusca]GGP54717.1 hypothetical protein GCM10010185_29030 [Saccharothrix coeruleofusca]
MRPRRGSARLFSPLIVLFLVLATIVAPVGTAQAAPGLGAPHITEAYSRDEAADVVFVAANQHRDPAAEWSITITAAPGGQSAVVKNREKTSARVKGLTNGTKYRFTAVETLGQASSPTSRRSEPVVPRTARRPLPPTIDSVFGREGSLVVHWNPGADRGAPITGYTVSASPSGRKVTVDGDTRTATLTGLPNGRAQTVSVAATNKIGTGKAATSPDAVPKPPYAPSRPRSVSATPSADGVQGSLDVAWQPPKDDGGAAITSYTVTASPGDKSVSVQGSVHQTRLTGLNPEVVHTVSVTAVNGTGDRLAAAATAKAKPGYKINGKTVKLTANSMDAISRVARDRVVFEQATPQVKKLDQGQIIVAEARLPRPRKGLLRKITEVRTSGEKVVLMTTDARLQEAIDTSSLRVAPRADWMRGGQVRSLVPEARVEAEQSLGGFSTDFTFKPQSHSSETKEQSEAHVGFEASVTGHVAITPDWSMDLDMSWLKLKSASLTARATVQASITGQLTPQFSGSYQPEKPLLEYKFPCFTTWIGWFPLVTCPEFTLNGTLGAEGSLQFTFNASYEQVVGGSLSYSGETGEWTPKTLTTAPATTFDPHLGAKAQVKLALPVDLQIRLYNVAGPGLQVTPSLAFDADSDRTPWGKVLLGVNVALTFRVPPLGLDRSTSVYTDEWPLWESSGKITTLRVSPTTRRVRPGESAQFTAESVGCDNAQPITWSLAEPALGSITPDGRYTAPASGSSQDRVIATQTASATCDRSTGEAFVQSGVVAPSAPQGLAARWEGENLVLTWSPPADDGHEAVLYGVVACRWTDFGDSCAFYGETPHTSATIGPDPNTAGQLVRATVLARNSAGNGPPAAYVDLH